MRTREKVVVLLVVAALILGAVIYFAFRENEVEANHFRWLLATNLKYSLSSPGRFVDELPAGSLIYGGLTIFAVVMAIIVLKMIRDGEIQALRRHLLNLRAEKNQTESLLQEEVWKGKHERQARDSVRKDLESSIDNIELLITELNEKEKLLKARDTELMAAKSGAPDYADSGPSKDPAERLLRDELKKKTEMLQASNSTINELQQRLSAKTRQWESQLREKDGLLKGREQELDGLRTEIVDLGGRLGEMEAAKKRAEDLLHEELRQKKQVLEANDLAMRTEEKRLSEKIRILESQVSEKERLLRTRDTEVNGFRKQLSELDAAKEQMESRFQEELRKVDQDRRAKEDIINDLEQRLGTSLHGLRNEVGEKDLLLQARDGELKALNSEVKAISLRLSEMAAAKVRAEESLGEELRKEKHQREADKTVFREKEEHLDKEILLLTAQLNERNEALKSRDGDIKSLRQEVKAVALRLDELNAAKEHTEALLQKELQEEKQQREAKELTSRELEERYGKQVQSLKGQLGEKDAFLASRNEEIKSLKTQVDSLAEQLSKLGSAKERAASLLQQKLRKEKEVLQASDSAIKEIEDSFKARIQSLEDQLHAKQELVGSRDREVDALTSEMASLNQRMAELGAAKEHTERLFQEAVRERADLLQSKDAGIKRLEEDLAEKLRRLESQLREKDELIHNGEAELNAFKNQLAELASSKEQAARTLQDDLRQKSELLDENAAAINALEERFSTRIHTLESALSEKQELIEARDAELKELRSKTNTLSGELVELETSKDHATRLLHEDLRQKTELLQSKESAMKALEERLTGKLRSLERQLTEKQKLLEAGSVELSELHTQMNVITERLNETETAKVYLEGSLQQQQSKADQALVSAAGLNGEAHDLDTLVSEREQLLKARDKLIQDLMTELKEKKTQLARQEIEVWQKIERREAWKHRLSKIGIRIKN